MDEGKKKLIMVVVLVACIAAAVVITVATHTKDPGSIDSLERGVMIWLKCRDPKCENSWQMDEKDYYEYVEKNRQGLAVPAIACPKCGGESGYIALKCGGCGLVFEKVPSSEGFPDKCPKCGYSAMEESRKAKKKAAGGN